MPPDASLPVMSFVTAAADGDMFVRLLVEHLRSFVGNRDDKIVVADEGSRDGMRAWLRAQPDVRLLTRRDVGNPSLPTAARGVFHAWYVSRLLHAEAEILRGTNGRVSRATYLEPLMARLRVEYGLAY